MPVSDEVQVLIVGGGVGGLALAGLLRRKGVDPVVVERATSWNDTTRGLLLWEGGLATLSDLGVASAVREAGSPLDGWTLHETDGSVRTHAELSPDDASGVVVEYGRLHESLRGTVPATSIRMGTSVRSLDRTGDHVTVQFTDGVREGFDVVVGADGVHSRVRRLIDAGEATFCGTTGWTLPVDPDVETPDGVTELWGADRTALVTVPTAGQDLAWLLAGAERAGQYDDAGTDVLRERFASLSWLVPDLLADADDETLCPIDDYRVRTNTWVDGRVALLGDAAHAHHPVAGVGTSLAMEDAAVLADELTSRRDGFDVRLRDYAGRRRSRVRRLERTAGLSTAFVATDSPLVSRLRDALALRSTALEAAFSAGERPLAPAGYNGQ